MTYSEILTVAIDAIKGKIGDYSAKQTSEDMRNAFIELNGGSTKLSRKNFYTGSELFSLIQELIPTIIEEGIQSETNPLFRLVDYRNIAAGDSQEFVTEGTANFVVASAASGIRDVRRQRIVGGNSVKIEPETKVVRVYENLGRLLAGRIDFNKFVDGVSNAFKAYIAQGAYDAIDGLSSSTAGLDATYVKTGSYNENDLITLIDHVEAATGMTAKIYGTRSALRKLTPSNMSDGAKDDLYNMGYYGRFNGTDMIRLNQAHKPGTSTFALNDNKVWVIASDDRPIKVVNSGEGIMIDKPAEDNADLTQEYIYIQGLGIGAICADKLGVYTMS